MTIESITKQKDKKGGYTITFEDGGEISVTSSLLAGFGVYPGRDLTQDEYEELCAEAGLSSSKARAMRILAHRDISKREIEKRLISKGETTEAAGQTAAWLESIGAINDTEYAHSIVHHYVKKGYGIARIREELYKRGIERELWEDALSDTDGMEDAAYEFVAKKLSGGYGKDELRRAVKALCARGFSYEEARSAVNKFLENLDDAGAGAI